jgi:hypothetical protein
VVDKRAEEIAEHRNLVSGLGLQSRASTSRDCNKEFDAKESNAVNSMTRRMITMNYIRPEVVKLADAVNAIQGPSKFETPSDHSETITAAGAYEADE